MSVDESVVVQSTGSTPVPPWDAGRSLGRLVVAWQNPEDRRIVPVGMLEHGPDGYRFRYLRRALRTPGFRPFLSFPEWYGDYRSEWLFPLFAQRIQIPQGFPIQTTRSPALAGGLLPATDSGHQKAIPPTNGRSSDASP